MQIAHVWSGSYKKNRGFDENEDLVMITGNSITARTQDGLRVTVDVSIHYKAGIALKNKTALVKEYLGLYNSYGEPLTSWK